MAENKTTGNAGAAAPPAAGFEAFVFSTRAWAAAESSRSPRSAVADNGDGALVAVLAFRRHDMLGTERALCWRRTAHRLWACACSTCGAGHCVYLFARFVSHRTFLGP
jgi:hypothetical protein